MTNSIEAAVRTATASRWELFCAQLFGRETVVVEADGTRVKIAHFRGRIYFLDATYPETES